LNATPVQGYPDRTFRGNRATTRFEFAAGLNACLDQIERLIAASGEGFATRKDLETIQRLVKEFQAELTAFGSQHLTTMSVILMWLLV
jgi:hypothetical protein